MAKYLDQPEKIVSFLMITLSLEMWERLTPAAWEFLSDFNKLYMECFVMNIPIETVIVPESIAVELVANHILEIRSPVIIEFNTLGSNVKHIEVVQEGCDLLGGVPVEVDWGK